MVPPNVRLMNSPRSFFRAIARCNAGSTSIEYGLIALVIAVAITVSAAKTGNGIDAVFSGISESLDGPASKPPAIMK
jgi:Flp pilus assembly pilin Flp